MKVRLRYDADGLTIDEVFSGHNSEEIVSAMKRQVSHQAGFAARLFIQTMSPLSFAQEVVRRYNRHANRDVIIPESCDHFIKSGEAEGILVILEP